MAAVQPAHRVSRKEVVFKLLLGFVLGRILWELSTGTVNITFPLMHGIVNEYHPEPLGYLDLFAPGPEPLHVNFRGYDIPYEYVLAGLAVLVVGAILSALAIAFARRHWPGPHSENEEQASVRWRACPECLSLIPAAARRCAHCRSRVEPLVAQSGAST
jgi:hypothetical protein